MPGYRPGADGRKTYVRIGPLGVLRSTCSGSRRVMVSTEWSGAAGAPQEFAVTGGPDGIQVDRALRARFAGSQTCRPRPPSPGLWRPADRERALRSFSE